MPENHPWNEMLDVGHQAMDHDHHTQIALVSAFAEAIEQGRPTLATRLGQQLGAYSRAHFQREELLMDALGYGDAAAHAAEHDAFLSRIQEVNAAHASGIEDLALSLAIDVRSALAAHMDDADRRVAAHVASRR